MSLDRDDGEGHDAPTSVAQIPEALLKSLRKPEVAPPAPPPAAPPPAAQVPTAPPPPSVDEEDDSDESATAVLVDAPRARLPALPRPASRLAPAAPAPPIAVERFAPVTEDSPDEDPSDTMLSTQLPDAMRPSSKSRVATPVDQAQAGPMFEPPSQDMLTPRPPPAMFAPPPAAGASPPFPVAMHRPIHEPVAAPKKSRRGLWIGLVVGACVLAAAITAGAVLLVQHFAS